MELENVVMQKMSKAKLESKQKRESRIKIDIGKTSTSGNALEKTAKKKKHKPNPKARRRLRSCILAVYFSIFIPSFSRKIYQNKLKKFMSLYPHEISKYYDKKDYVSRFKKE